MRTGAGHHLPTYVTPALFATVSQIDQQGGEIAGTGETRVIQRRVLLSDTEQRELFDTRIPAGGTWIFTYHTQRSPEAVVLRTTIEVSPDHYYQGFFETYRTLSLLPEVRRLIEEAYIHAYSTSYLLTTLDTPLPLR